MRKGWVCVLLAATLAAGCSAGEETTPAAAGAEEAASAFREALVARDTEALDRLIADELLWVRGGGQTGGKREFIAALTDPSLQLDPIEPIDDTWIDRDGAALEAAELKLTGWLDGDRVTDHHRFVDFWILRDGSWRLAYIQSTPIAEE